MSASVLFRVLFVLMIVTAAVTAKHVDVAKRANTGTDCLATEIVYCFVDPCSVAECPRYSDAVCIANYCGGCNAEFFVGEKEVHCGGNNCPGGNYINCLVDPCMFAECPRDSDAECIANYCGGCNAEFFVDGKKIRCTPRDCNGKNGHHEHGSSYPAEDGCNTCTCYDGNEGCTERACIKEGQCPAVTGLGICVELCSNDIDCEGVMKCCSNGCGHVCMEPVFGADCNGHEHGTSYPTDDGCNTCTCDNGREFCTLRACVPID